MKRFLRCVALLLLGSASLRAADAPAEDRLQVAQKVHDIFEAKCADCHGPELPRPKGKFGYVLDLRRIAANPDYVVPGKPDKSDLFTMVNDEEMPGEDANVPPLTAEEKAAVKRWIEAGAPGDLPGGAKRPSVPPAPPKKAPEPFFRHLLRWSGQLHPVTTHFPIALMLVAVLAEGLAWATKRESWRHTVQFLVVLAALGGIVAAVLGWINASFSSYNKALWALLWWHRWMGTGAALWAVVCAFASFAPGADKERHYFRIALFIGGGLVGLSGFLGGSLIYGLDHYLWR